MMATTHGFVGLALAVVVLPVLPAEASAPLVFGGAFVGGLAPDLDLLGVHRRTLHFPVVGPALALLGSVGVVLTGSGTLAVATVFVASGAVHAVSDVLGGSAETEPWNPTTERGVYDHVTGRWWRPRRLVPYSGAPADFLVGLPFAALSIVAPATGPTGEAALVAVLVGSGLYTLTRRQFGRIHHLLVTVAAPLFPTAPPVDEGEADPVAGDDD